MRTMLAQRARTGQSRGMGVRFEKIHDIVRGDVDVDGATVVLVDRLWPRGVSKESFPHDEWCKDAAPSTELRRHFHGGDLDFEEFSERYRAELAGEPAATAVDHLADLASSNDLVLAFGARDTEHNHAAVLAEVVLSGRPDGADPRR